MPENIFKIIGEKEKDYETLSDTEKIKKLETVLQGQRMLEMERCVYLSEITGKMRKQLHYILGYAELAMEGDCSEASLKESFDIIMTSGNKMAKYLFDLKRRMWENNFSKKGVSEKKYWNEILEKIGNTVQPMLVPKHLTLTVDFSDVVHTGIQVELFQIYLILWNLIENAVQFSKAEGEIFVRIREMEYEKKGYSLFEIRVQDTGIGISEEFMPKLFEFHEKEQREEIASIGRGIGLGVVKRAVERLEGTIRAESILGIGSTFTVLLPLRVKTEGEE